MLKTDCVYVMMETCICPALSHSYFSKIHGLCQPRLDTCRPRQTGSENNDLFEYNIIEQGVGYSYSLATDK